MKRPSDLQASLDEIEERLGYTFKDRALLLEAFVHRSYLNENDEDVGCNERLEFLGDSVLGLIASHDLFSRFSNAPEGDLSSLRAQLIDATACAAYAKALGLDAFVLMGKGERVNLGKGRASLLADLLEAVLGALFVDGGFAAAENFAKEKLHPLMRAQAKRPQKNYKALVQTFAQRTFKQMPLYSLVEERGPEHMREFCIELIIDDKPISKAWGDSKKQAERLAAELAWREIQRREGADGAGN